MKTPGTPMRAYGERSQHEAKVLRTVNTTPSTTGTGGSRTPLEALAAGVAPLVLDTPIARETCADAARYVSSGAPAAQVARAMAELLTNAPARRARLQRGTSVLSRYDWDLTAGDTLKVLEEAAIGR